MSEIENKCNQKVGSSFSEIFDLLKEKMIEQKCNKAQYIGKGEFVLFNDENKSICESCNLELWTDEDTLCEFCEEEL